MKISSCMFMRFQNQVYLCVHKLKATNKTSPNPMKHLRTLLILSIFCVSLSAQPNYAWVLNGNQAGDFAEITDIAIDANGNSYVLLSYSEPITFGSVTVSPVGGLDLAVVKFNADGVAQWVINAGSATNDRGNAIAVDNSGAAYVTGYITSDAFFDNYPLLLDNIADLSTEYFVGKIDPNGQWLWVRQQNSQAIAEGVDIAVDNDGNVVVGGKYFAADLVLDGQTLNSVNQLPFVAKYTNAGSIQWAFNPETDWGASFSALAIGVSNEIVFCGSFGTAEAESVSLTAGNVVLTNVGDVDSTTAGDVYVLALNSAGLPIWGQHAGALRTEAYATDIAVGAGGSVYISGFFNDSISNFESINLATFGIEAGEATDFDGFIASLSPFGGEWNWIQRIGTAGYDLGQLRLSASSNGVIYLSVTALADLAYNLGDLQFTPTAGETSLISRINSDGSFLWAYSMPDLYAFATSSENQLRVGGKFTATESFGSLTLTATGGTSGTDVYVGKVQYGPDIPSVLWHANEADAAVYPNPFVDYINLKCDGEIRSTHVIDATGRIVEVFGNSTQLNLQHLEKGNYVLRIIKDEGVITKRIVKN